MLPIPKAPRRPLPGWARGQLGTYVSVHGKGLLGGGTALKSITLGGKAPFELISATDVHIRVRVGESTDLGLGDVVIISNTQALVYSTNGWTYDVGSDITGACVKEDAD